MDFNFHMPVKIISGEDCVRLHPDVFRALGRRCFLLTGGHAAEVSGALPDVREALRAAGVEMSVFAGIGANPLLSECRKAALAAEEFGADFIVGIGGGSAMDAAKATAWLAANGRAGGDDLMSRKLKNPALPLVLVGTTAGTGSEVSAAAVLTIDGENRKRSVTDSNCYARCVFADPRYTHSMPRNTTVSTALDAFSHAAEGWFAPGCGDVITSFGEKALPLVTRGLYWLAEHDGLPDEKLRERLYYGSLWAGVVLNATGTAFPHPLGYLLTENYGLPHGMACAVFLPVFLHRAEQYSPARAERFYELCGGRGPVYAMLKKLVRHSVSMTAEQADAYSKRWVGNKNFTRVPGGFTAEDAAAVYRELFVKNTEG